eukprot:scaffold307_cov390-Prasinococcus_capsulatus_cf.AAC.35
MIGESYLSSAYQIIRQSEEKGEDVNLVISDLEGFGAWAYRWRIPEYDPVDLRFSNMFHCSAIFRKTMWSLVKGYNPSTLFGYEDWSFWISVEEAIGIRPRTIRQDLFKYRLRSDSMHQSLLSNQEYSLASLRIIHPHLYPLQLVLTAHALFLQEAPAKVLDTVAEKLAKFPRLATPHTMTGLLLEGRGRRMIHEEATRTVWKEALEHYDKAYGVAEHHDWQPKWRKGLLLIDIGRMNEAYALLYGDLFPRFAALQRTFETEFRLEYHYKLMSSGRGAQGQPSVGRSWTHDPTKYPAQHSEL